LDVAFEWVVVLFIFREVVCPSLYQEDWLVWVFLVVSSVSVSKCCC
jgi:hypothetical protein